MQIWCVKVGMKELKHRWDELKHQLHPRSPHPNTNPHSHAETSSGRPSKKNGVYYNSIGRLKMKGMF